MNNGFSRSFLPTVVRPFVQALFNNGVCESKFYALFTRCLSVGEQWSFLSIFPQRCSPVVRPLLNDGRIEDKFIALFTRCLSVGEQRALFEPFSSIVVHPLFGHW